VKNINNGWGVFMGCDIHFYTEVLRTIDDKKTWCCCDLWKLNPYYKVFEDEPEYEIEELYGDRDYNLFSILAGVRNYSDIVPISKPRGLPDGVSTAVKAASDKWDGDGHSHSWFTLYELMSENSRRLCSSPLDDLVNLCVQRMKKELHILDNKEVAGEARRFRIVFWFDN